jgi:hypothetical protein
MAAPRVSKKIRDFGLPEPMHGMRKTPGRRGDKNGTPSWALQHWRQLSGDIGVTP